MASLHYPNSDSQRLRALRTAQYKADTTDSSALAFGSDTRYKLQIVCAEFAAKVEARNVASQAEALAVANTYAARRILNMYIRHFILVFNMAVDRGTFSAVERVNYKLTANQQELPRLVTDAENLHWATNIVKGDAIRVAAGGKPMENPSAAEVEVALNEMKKILTAQIPTKEAFEKAQQNVEDMREEVDGLISAIWKEVLFAFRRDSALLIRRKAREYGLMYRLDVGEQPTPDEFSIQGNVSELVPNGMGAPLVDVTVDVLGMDGAVLTNVAGNYLMPLLPADIYTLRFSKENFVSVEVQARVTTGKILTLNVQLIADSPEE